MNKIERIRAFSLIELSIVILIIGILVIGITKGSRIIKASKLSSAKTLTRSSPVASIENLVVWLEPTSDSAFKNQSSSLSMSDGNTVSAWIENNPLKLNNASINQATVGDQPKYVADGINGLPTIRFNQAFTTQKLKTLDVMAGYNTEVTYFVVLRVSTTASRGEVICVGGKYGASEIGHELWVETNGSLQSNFYTGSANQGTILSSAGLVNLNRAFVVTNNFSGRRNLARLYYNKTLINTATAGFQGVYGSSSTDNGIIIGNHSTSPGLTLGGDVSEIIVYDRFLTDTEMASVQNYLIQKYNIK